MIALVCSASALGQHNLLRTITVDPSGNADHTTIQAGINDTRIGSNPTQRFTVLIYAGTYAENVQLGGLKENVNLVGVDRDAVIIAPASGTGVTITSGTEVARNNRIANLTIKTADGDGIETSTRTSSGDEPSSDGANRGDHRRGQGDRDARFDFER